MDALPRDAFERLSARPFEPVARRSLSLLGGEAELLLLPGRKARHGKPGPERRPFVPDAAQAIIQREALWQAGRLALTPNRHPFAERQLLLWSTVGGREADEEMLGAAFEFAAARGASVLVNSIGAAASIPRAHLHLLDERLPFLPALPARRCAEPWLIGWPEVDLKRLAPPYPAEVLVVEGETRARARALRRLLDLRCCAAFNLCDDGERSWLFPRSNREIAGPAFPQALGAAEIWGRWLFQDEEAYAAATAEALSEVLRVGGFANPLTG